MGKDESCLFASKDLMIGEVNALVKVLGGEKVVRGILNGSLEVTITPKPSTLGTLHEITFHPYADSFDPERFFQVRKGLYVLGGFRDRIISMARKIKKVPTKKGMFIDLDNPASDTEIRAKLPKGHVFKNPSIFCSYLARQLDLQKNGEAGELLNDGYTNIFYVKGINGKIFAVLVRWDSDDRAWDVDADQLDGYRWHVGLRVFSATAVA